jgi:hypothetical protein
MREERAAQYIRDLLDQAPPLEPEQLQRLAGLLTGPGA